MREHGIDPSGKHARRVSQEDYEAYDYLIAMDRVNLRNMKRLFDGDAQGKCFCLLDLTDRPREIADPWYTGNFRDTWDDVYEGCLALMQRLSSEI